MKLLIRRIILSIGAMAGLISCGTENVQEKSKAKFSVEDILVAQAPGFDTCSVDRFHESNILNICTKTIGGERYSCQLYYHENQTPVMTIKTVSISLTKIANGTEKTLERRMYSNSAIGPVMGMRPLRLSNLQTHLRAVCQI